MSSSFLNLTNYYSPPGATLPAAASTPQPIPQNEQIDFNYDALSHGPSSLSKSMAPQYMHNVDGDSVLAVWDNAETDDGRVKIGYAGDGFSANRGYDGTEWW
ncbi:hypothetical protein ACEPPN_004026 [Leptodophora sp. 'Broadleaf-Isolate-01']